jgi:hypothetical protein
MGLDLDGPAQSHASNVIDSVVLALHGKNGRDNAKAPAQAVFDDLPLQLAAENLTLRPLFCAFTTWWPSSGVTPPEHFARHPTAHAAGHAGVFFPRPAPAAVMLATSLTVQHSGSRHCGRTTASKREIGSNPTRSTRWFSASGPAARGSPGAARSCRAAGRARAARQSTPRRGCRSCDQGGSSGGAR